MGSSVFHGGASTFLAISVLGFSQTYTFQVFFKTWFGIVIFGMANGFLLLPVILSLIGPLGPNANATKEGNDSKRTSNELAAMVSEQGLNLKPNQAYTKD